MFRWLNDSVRGAAQLFLSGHECRCSPRRGPAVALPCVTTIDGDEATQDAPLDRVFDAMRGGSAGRAAALHVRLGSALVYQDAVGVDTARLSRGALQSVLAAHWHAALGDVHGPLAISFSVQAAGRSVVTSCTGQGLVRRIRDAAARHGFRVLSIAPYSAGVWNAHRRSIADRSGYLVVGEEDFVTIGAYHDGAWCAWTGEARDGGEWGGLARSVQRFARCRGLAEDWPVWVHAEVGSRTAPASAGLGHWRVLGARAPLTSEVAP